MGWSREGPGVGTFGHMAGTEHMALLDYMGSSSGSFFGFVLFLGHAGDTTDSALRNHTLGRLMGSYRMLGIRFAACMANALPTIVSLQANSSQFQIEDVILFTLNQE